MTHPTNKELAERLRELPEVLSSSLADVVAALDAMPEADEEAKWKSYVNNRLCALATTLAIRAEDIAEFSALKQMWRDLTGTPWTPPQPERVTDEELDDLLASVTRRGSIDRDDVQRALEHYKEMRQAERARRAGKGKK